MKEIRKLAIAAWIFTIIGICVVASTFIPDSHSKAYPMDNTSTPAPTSTRTATPAVTSYAIYNATPQPHMTQVPNLPLSDPWDYDVMNCQEYGINNMTCVYGHTFCNTTKDNYWSAWFRSSEGGWANWFNPWALSLGSDVWIYAGNNGDGPIAQCILNGTCTSLANSHLVNFNTYTWKWDDSAGILTHGFWTVYHMEYPISGPPLPPTLFKEFTYVVYPCDNRNFLPQTLLDFGGGQ